MRKIPKKVFSIIAVCILVLVLMTTMVSAETDPGWGTQDPQIDVPFNNYSDTWSLPMRIAAAEWNSTPTKVSIAVSSSSKNQVLAASYSDSWYGLASSANPLPFTIKLNARTISRDATNLSNFIKSVLVHEYGHIFCLDHTNTKASIMYSSRDRNTMTTPQQFDIDEVNTVYK